MPRAKALPVIDGRTLGADCDNCPLNGNIVVPPTTNKKPLAIILAEGPGFTEEAKQEPLVGESGQLMDRILDWCGEHRSSFHLTNTVLCRTTKSLSPAEWKKARDACRPRLERELKQVRTKSVIAFGKHALTATTGKQKITDWMGAPLKGEPDTFFDGYNVLAMYHPAHALREPHWIPVLARHLHRGILLAKGELPAWKWPTTYTEGEGLTKALLKILQTETLVAVDVETDGLDPLKAKLLNVGIAALKFAVSVQWDRCSARQKKLVAQILKNRRIKKICHNGQYDELSLETNGLPMEGYEYDTLYAASVLSPRLPRKLDILACIEFPAERWKTTFRITKDTPGTNRFVSADPYERAIYNARDAWITLLLWRKLSERIQTDVHNGPAMLAEYMELNRIAIEMRKTGFATEQNKLDFHKARLMRRMRDAKRDLVGIAQAHRCSVVTNKSGEKQPFNPNSNVHLRKLLVEKLGVIPRAFSEKTQQPKFDEKVLLDLAATGSPTVKLVARRISKYRQARKYLKTYVMPIYGIGRVHATANPSGAKTGRWSYQDPSLQVIPKSTYKKLKNGKEVIDVPGLRDLFRATKGKRLVEVDYKTLEVFIIALLSGDERLIAMCQTGDPHSETAKLLFGDVFTNAADKLKKHLRQLCKHLRFAWQYGANAETAWRTYVLMFPELTLGQVEELWIKFAAAHPKILAWHRAQKESAYKNDYIEAPISGRRYWFHGVVEPNKCYNLPVQMTAADLINAAIRRIWKRLKRPDEMLLVQIHDALIGEAINWRRFARLLKEEMEREVELNGARVRFMVEISAGENWGNMEKIELDEKPKMRRAA